MKAGPLWLEGHFLFVGQRSVNAVFFLIFFTDVGQRNCVWAFGAFLGLAISKRILVFKVVW